MPKDQWKPIHRKAIAKQSMQVEREKSAAENARIDNRHWDTFFNEERRFYNTVLEFLEKAIKHMQVISPAGLPIGQIPANVATENTLEAPTHRVQDLQSGITRREGENQPINFDPDELIPFLSIISSHAPEETAKNRASSLLATLKEKFGIEPDGPSEAVQVPGR